MVEEVLTALQIKPNGAYIDCTTGEGGHSLAILSAVSPAPRLLSLDLDSQALLVAKQRLEQFGDNVTLVNSSYANMKALAEEHGFAPADGILLDLGISSLQVNEGDRGFSFNKEAPLDMRFDTNQQVTAYEIVNGYLEESLANTIYQLGDERRSRRIARAIVRNRPIETTTRLAEVVARAAGGSGKSRIHPATKTFQAIRMAVNGELDNIQQGLQQAIEILATGGRLAVISYHSLEDGLVKNKLRHEALSCICPPEVPICVCEHKPTVKLVPRRVIKPSDEEVRGNPRSRSARMRVAERI